MLDSWWLVVFPSIEQSPNLPPQRDLQQQQAVALTDSMKCRTGLGNLMDAVDVAAVQTGYDETHAIDLGTNPELKKTTGTCQHAIPEIVDISCASDVNGNFEEEVYYKFRMKWVDSTFYNLRINPNPIGADFRTQPSLRSWNGLSWVPAPGLVWDWDTLSNGDTLTWKTIPYTQIPNWTATPGDTFADFLLTVDARVGSPSTGFFRTFVFIENPSGPTPVDHEDYPTLIRSGCRIAVDDGKENQSPQQNPMAKGNRLRLIPNPATNRVQLQWSGKQAMFDVVDALGRKAMLQQILDEMLELNIADWPTGLYYIRIITESGFESHPLQIIR